MVWQAVENNGKNRKAKEKINLPLIKGSIVKPTRSLSTTLGVSGCIRSDYYPKK